MTAHLTDVELRDFVAGASSPADVLRADDHLSGCDRCRTRAFALAGSATTIDNLQAQLAPSIHLSDEQLQQLADGRLTTEANVAAQQHLASCSTCAKQWQDLRAWSRPTSVVRSRRLALAAAAVLAILIPAAIWQARPGRPTTPMPIGFEALAAPEQARVRVALSSGVATLPDFMTDLEPPREVLMGAATRRDAFRLTAPVATATLSDRPQLAWESLSGADGYVVTVLDERSTEVARSPVITETTWTPAGALSRGKTYLWQVTARRGVETITTPAAPMPPAKFHVVDTAAAEMLTRVEANQPQAHLVLGILNMQAGIRDAAARHLRQVPPDDRHADLAKQSLERLNAGR